MELGVVLVARPAEVREGRPLGVRGRCAGVCVIMSDALCGSIVERHRLLRQLDLVLLKTSPVVCEVVRYHDLDD